MIFIMWGYGENKSECSQQTYKNKNIYYIFFTIMFQSCHRTIKVNTIYKGAKKGKTDKSPSPMQLYILAAYEQYGKLGHSLCLCAQ